MSVVRPGMRLAWLLRLLPGSWLAALDAWSAKVAVQRAERRRQVLQAGRQG